MAVIRDIPTITSADAGNLPGLIGKLQKWQDLLRLICGFTGDGDLALVNRVQLRDIGLVDADGNPVGGGSGGSTDLTPPPAPSGFTASGGLAHVFAEWAPPTYTQGGGNAQTNIYGAQYSGSGSLPVFGDAELIDTEVFTTSVASIPSEPSTIWRLWATHVTTAGVEGPPAGGTNGVEAKTGVDVSNMLDALTEAAQRPGGPLTKTLFRADLFGIGPELDFNQEATPTGTTVGQLWLKPSTGATKVWNGTAWSTFNVPLPFIVNTTTQVIGGVTYPPGVYITQAVIYDLTALIARLGTAWIDNAMISSLSASKITAGSISVGNYLQSAGYTGSGSSEWRIDGNGTARFANGIFSGTVYASAGSIGGADILSNRVESTNFDGAGTGWQLANSGTAQFGSLLVSNIGATRVFNTAATGTQSVLKIGTTLNILANGSATLGDLNVNGDIVIASGGNVRMGQTAFNTGTGFFLGDSGGTAKFSVGSSTKGVSWDGADFQVKGVVWDAFTASISGGDITWDQNFTTVFPSRTVSVSGGRSPFKYQWLLIPTKYQPYVNTYAAQPLAMILLGSTTATATVEGKGVHVDGDWFYGHLGCLVTDANGRNTFVRVSVNMFFLEPDPGPIGGAE